MTEQTPASDAFIRFTQTYATWLWLYGGGLVLLVGSAFFWWNNVSINPQRVFWGMINQSLSTSAVTVQSTQSTNGTDVSQTIQYQTGAQDLARSLTTVKQANTTINTETLGTPTADYTHYLSIKTDQKTKAGKLFDATSLKNVWAKSGATSSDPTNSAKLFHQAILGTSQPIGAMPIPVAQLSSSNRASIVQDMRANGLYGTTLNKPKKSTQNGRLQYTYSLSMQPILYVHMMKDFASDLGLADLNKADPNQYEGAQAIPVSVTVDAHSRTLVKVDLAGQYIQTYSAFGVPVGISVPAHTVTSAVLKSRLSALQ